jgi:hypothetical protein
VRTPIGRRVGWLSLVWLASGWAGLEAAWPADDMDVATALELLGAKAPCVVANVTEEDRARRVPLAPPAQPGDLPVSALVAGLRMSGATVLARDSGIAVTFRALAQPGDWMAPTLRMARLDAALAVFADLPPATRRAVLLGAYLRLADLGPGALASARELLCEVDPRNAYWMSPLAEAGTLVRLSVGLNLYVVSDTGQLVAFVNPKRYAAPIGALAVEERTDLAEIPVWVGRGNTEVIDDAIRQGLPELPRMPLALPEAPAAPDEPEAVGRLARPSFDPREAHWPAETAMSFGDLVAACSLADGPQWTCDPRLSGGPVLAYRTTAGPAQVLETACVAIGAVARDLARVVHFGLRDEPSQADPVFAGLFHSLIARAAEDWVEPAIELQDATARARYGATLRALCWDDAGSEVERIDPASAADLRGIATLSPVRRDGAEALEADTWAAIAAGRCTARPATTIRMGFAHVVVQTAPPDPEGGNAEPSYRLVPGDTRSIVIATYRHREVSVGVPAEAFAPAG